MTKIRKEGFVLEGKPSYAGSGLSPHYSGRHHRCPPGYTAKNAVIAGASCEVEILHSEEGIVLKCECGAESPMFTNEEIHVPHWLWG